MDEREAPDPLRDLGARIDKAYGTRGAAPGGPGDTTRQSNSALSMGLRIGLELIVGVGAGLGVGFMLDRWLGTKPWLMILCFFLGVAAGLVNVYRTIKGLGMAAGYKQAGSRMERRPDKDWDED
jgi:ATP synthase protein I